VQVFAQNDRRRFLRIETQSVYGEGFILHFVLRLSVEGKGFTLKGKKGARFVSVQ